MNTQAIEAAGFAVNKDGRVIQHGKLVPQAVADQVSNGSILANFNMDELRKTKARKAATGTTDLVTALAEISPAIGLLSVGQVAKIPMPKTAVAGKDPKRSFVMSVVTKLNNITSKGREWAGRKFDSMSDVEGEYFYVARLEDGEPHVRATGGGKKKANANNNLNQALAALNTSGQELTEEATVIRHT